jgi:phage terminase large subunit-like protein
MGKRGPGARKRLDAAEAATVAYEPPSWGAPGLTRAGRVIAFMESLPRTKGLGPSDTIQLMGWQRDWIDAVYATDAAGKRLVRTGLLSAARGQGKTVLIAGLCLAHLVGPESEARGEVYSAATTRDQAALTFAEIEAWCLAVPWIAARVNVKRFGKIIEDDFTGSLYRALASDGPAAHGLASSFIACDELAQWKRRELFDVLRTSMGKRQEPLMCIISTQSARADNTLSELIDYGARIESGEVTDPSFHAKLFTAPEGCALDDESAWAAANPALGVFRSLDELASEAQRAKRMPAFEPAFRNLYLNQRVDSESAAIRRDEWEACGKAVDAKKLKGKRCWAGLDLSSTRDLTALVLLFECGSVLSWFWVPKTGLAEKEETDRVPYRTWAKQGLITPTPGKAIDKRFVAAALAQIVSTYDVQSVAFDRFGIQELKVILDSEGVSVPLVEHGQGYRDMGPSVNAFETRLLNEDLRHGNHPILRWMSGNLVFETDPTGNRKPSKQRSIDKIDGMVALIMACGIAAKHESEPQFDASRAIVFL